MSSNIYNDASVRSRLRTAAEAIVTALDTLDGMTAAQREIAFAQAKTIYDASLVVQKILERW